MIPKRHRQNKWRLIVDLSSPEGHSVNDGIDSTTCSLSYVSVDDNQSASKNRHQTSLPANPCPPPGLTFTRYAVAGKLFHALPFGLRSAPLIFSAGADALEWVARSRGAERIFHYIDDFVMVAPPQSDASEYSLRTLLQTCDNLGMPITHEKTEGPSTRLTILGIEFDTETMELPAEKIERLTSLLEGAPRMHFYAPHI